MMHQSLSEKKFLPDTKRVFLADGDALNLDSEYMIKIIKYIKEKFANLERISCYAMPKRS